jgi:hypothetical protein
MVTNCQSLTLSCGNRAMSHEVSQRPCLRACVIITGCLHRYHTLHADVRAVLLLLLQHPSLKPGVGRRWGWNLQFDASLTRNTGPGVSGGSLEHIHHTSLGLVKGPEGGEGQGGAEGLMQPGPHTRPPTTPG